MRRGCALVLASVVMAGCSGHDHGATAPAKRPEAKKAQPGRLPGSRAGTGRAHGRDLAWLARLHAWQVRLGVALDRSDAVYRDVVAGRRPRSELRPALRPLVRCADSLHRQVGEPRTEPYPPIYVELQNGCKSLRHAALALARTLGDHRSHALKEVRKTAPRIDTFFEQANKEILWTMRANRKLPTKGGLTTVSRYEPHLSRAGSLLVFKHPRGVAVRCWSKREWKLVTREYTTYFGDKRNDLLGFAQDTNANISSLPCGVLARLVYLKRRPAGGKALLLAAASVEVLAHELEHVYEDGVPGEAVTECHALQTMPRLGRLLGLPASYARLLADTYWKYVYPLNSPRYKTPRCRPGGPYDDHPRQPVWP